MSLLDLECVASVVKVARIETDDDELIPLFLLEKIRVSKFHDK